MGVELLNDYSRSSIAIDCLQKHDFAITNIQKIDIDFKICWGMQYWLCGNKSDKNGEKETLY